MVGSVLATVILITVAKSSFEQTLLRQW